MAELKCKKCVHFYRVMATGGGLQSVSVLSVLRRYREKTEYPNPGMFRIQKNAKGDKEK